MGDGSLCPDHLDLLAAPGHEAAVVSLLRDWLSRPGGRLLDLRGIRAGSRLIEALPAVFAASRWPWPPLRRCPTAQRPTGPPCPRSSVGISVNPPAASRPKACVIGRSGARRSSGVSTPCATSTSRSGEAAPASFPPSIASSPGAPAASRSTRWSSTNSGDNLVVATVLAFEVAGRVSLYQSARLTDPRWRDATTTLLAAIIDDACDRGFTEVDFLRGEESYKGRFTPNHREMFRLVAGKEPLGRLGCRHHHGDVPRHAGCGPVRSFRAIRRCPMEAYAPLDRGSQVRQHWLPLCRADNRPPKSRR